MEHQESDNRTSAGPSRLTRNTSYLTAAYSVQKILAFLYFSHLSNGIGDVNLGKMTFALGLTSIFGIFIDFGLGSVLTREIAKHREKLPQYFQTILALKVVLAAIFLSLVLPTFHVLKWIRSFTLEEPFPVENEQLILIGMAIILLDSFTFTFYSVFRGFQQMQYEASSVLIYQLVVITFGTLSISAGLPVHFVVLAILAGSVFNFAYSLLLVVFKAKMRIRLNWDWPFFRKLLVIAAPFAIANIFFKLSGTMDVLMLGVLAGDRYIAWYAIAFKLLTALTVLPGALATSYFPAMSEKIMKSPTEATRIFEKAMRYLMVISLPMMIGILVLSKEIVLSLFKPEFSASGDALFILAFGIPFLFLNYPVGNLLNAANRQLLNTINMGIAMAANFLLNLWLIPSYTFIGASISMLVSTILLLVLGLPWARKILPFNVKQLVWQFIRITLVSILMGVVLYNLRGSFHFSVLILIGMAVYFPILYVSGVVTRSEIHAIYQSFRVLLRRFV